MPLQDYGAFWNSIADRMEYSVIDQSQEGDDALFVFIGKLLRLFKSEPSPLVRRLATKLV